MTHRSVGVDRVHAWLRCTEATSWDPRARVLTVSGYNVLVGRRCRWTTVGVEDHGLRVGGQWSGHDYHIDPRVVDRMCIGREGCNTV